MDQQHALDGRWKHVYSADVEHIVAATNDTESPGSAPAITAIGRRDRHQITSVITYQRLAFAIQIRANQLTSCSRFDRRSLLGLRVDQFGEHHVAGVKMQVFSSFALPGELAEDFAEAIVGIANLE